MQRRVLTVVVAGQVLGGAGLAAGVTVGARCLRLTPAMIAESGAGGALMHGLHRNR
jgi:hypothetical protein